MKAARQKKRDMLEFFQWLEAFFNALPSELARLLLLYGLTREPKLDAKEIHGNLTQKSELSTALMSAAAELYFEGEIKGIIKGKILILSEMLGHPMAQEDLRKMSLEELEALFARVEAEYDARFKGR
jgi:hypothetical protein